MQNAYITHRSAIFLAQKPHIKKTNEDFRTLEDINQCEKKCQNILGQEFDSEMFHMALFEHIENPNEVFDLKNGETIH